MRAAETGAGNRAQVRESQASRAGQSVHVMIVPMIEVERKAVEANSKYTLDGMDDRKRKKGRNQRRQDMSLLVAGLLRISVNSMLAML